MSGAGFWLACGSVLLCACAQQAAAPAAHTASQLMAADVRLEGLWLEYWARAGHADTQRFMFLDGERFAWAAPALAEPQRATRKLGRYALERQGEALALVLHVSAEEFAACAAPCSTEPQRVEHAAPLVERYELGECAPNQEARAVDAAYACIAIGGRAFWRRPLPAADDALLHWAGQ